MVALVDKPLAVLRAVPIVASAKRHIGTVAKDLRDGGRSGTIDVHPDEYKYLKYPRQIARSVYLARSLGLDRRQPLQILDIGTGPGYFPFVAKSMGHDVTALDVDWSATYNALTRSLAIERVIHEIRRFEPLPPIAGPFDLITAFMICFNGHKQKVWGAPEWDYFVGQLRKLAKASGTRVMLGFNLEYDGTTGPPEVADYFKSIGAQFPRRGRVVDFVLKPD